MALTFVNTLRSRATVGFGDISSTVANIGTSYQKLTSPECKAIDAFLAFAMLTGVAQAVYCLLGSSYPYNAFLGVFAASVGLFVFAGTIVDVDIDVDCNFAFHHALCHVRFSRHSQCQIAMGPATANQDDCNSTLHRRVSRVRHPVESLCGQLYRIVN